MNWFYAEASQQKGPVSEMELSNLVQQGTIKPETLIWREGLPDWQPLSVSRPDLLTSSAAPILGGVAVPEQNKDLVVQQMREGTLLPGAAANPYGLRYAGFWIRVAAWIIDYIVIMAMFIPLMLLFFGGFGVFTGGMAEGMDPNDPEALGKILAMQGVTALLSFVIHIGYKGLMTWKWGATIGKLAVGIKVVTAEGAPLTFGRSIGRAAADLINYFICYLTYIMVGVDEPQKRGLHDHIAGTRVVYK